MSTFTQKRNAKSYVLRTHNETILETTREFPKTVILTTKQIVTEPQFPYKTVTFRHQTKQTVNGGQ